MENKMRFIFGEYDNRIFQGETCYGKTPFRENIDVYSLNEILSLTSVRDFVKTYEEEYGDWEKLTITEKGRMLEQYFTIDTLFGLLYFEDETEAEKYKDDVIKEVYEIENNSRYVGKRQNEFGELVEVFVSK